MLSEYYERFNTVKPSRAVVNKVQDRYDIIIFGLDSYNDEITVASYSNFPTIEYAVDKAKEFRVPRSQTVCLNN